MNFVFYKQKNEENNTIDKPNIKTSSTPNSIISEELKEDIWFIDEKGREYRMVETSREVPRKTFIKAYLKGKYWGEIDEQYSNQFQQSEFFEFNIYEAILNDASYKTDSPFQLEEDLRIPRDKFPKLLNTILEKDGETYEVNLREPVFSNIKIDRKLHQNDGKQVFGTIEATITGYILDFVTEYYSEKEYKISEPELIPIIKKPLEKILTPSGLVDYKENYSRTEYYYSDNKNTYWGDWKYKEATQTFNIQGCFSTLIGIVFGIIGIAVLLMLLPQLAFFIPFILIILLLNLIPSKVYIWIFNVLGLLLLLAFIFGLGQFFISHSNTYTPKPIVVIHPEETKPQFEPVIDTINNKQLLDTLIINHRVWHDYDGNEYSGKIWTRKSDYVEAQRFKNNYAMYSNDDNSYDRMIYSLKENDKNKLSGVYHLFDSIRNNNQLSHINFAEVLVSFVQDIPYSLILHDACNPDLYDDNFIREYLSDTNSRCAGFEKFGINSPVEFMSSLYGDCDTRTLLLYTMLSNYGYDVAVLSSEFYSHSLIGINLPINGIAYNHRDRRYVLWETTAANIRPGLLPKEISNLNYWRISLKSK